MEAPDKDSEAPEKLEQYMDWAFERVGDWGTFQHRGVALAAAGNVLCGMQTLAHIFVSLPPEVQQVCTEKMDHCSDELLSKVDCSSSAQEYRFISPGSSIISDFHLVCESAFQVPLVGTIYFFGFLLGVTFFGSFADLRGRRQAYIGGLIIVQMGALAIVAAPSYAVYAAARFVIGFAIGGFGLVNFVWCAEVVGVQYRSLVMVTSGSGFALGIVLLSPLAYAIPNWRWFLLVCFILGLPLICFQSFMLESPRWLAGPGEQIAEAHSVLCQIAAINGRPSPPPPKASEASNGEESQDLHHNDSTLSLLLLDERLNCRFIVMCFAWFAVSFGYYGVSMSASSIGLNVYLSSALLAVAEIPIYPLSLWLVESGRLGRRGTTAAGLAVGGLCCLLSAAIPVSNTSILVTLALAGKACISGSFGVVYLYAAELFPTNLRSRSMSLQSLVARIGSMAAPVVADLGGISHALPFTMFGVPCLLAGMLLCTLPETAGQPLLNNIVEIELPPKRKSLCPCDYTAVHTEET